jgi:hypothetical protein
VNFVAAPTHCRLTPKYTASSSFNGGVMIPPISPVVCQPLA